MSLWELFIIAVGLSMDAFAVSICKGLSADRTNWKQMLTAGLWFGGFQALMPLAGWLLGTGFQSLITTVDHWIAFFLLCLIGGNMVRESRSEEDCADGSFAAKAMLPLAVATSIDALAVGVSMAFMSVHILASAAVIGVVAFALSVTGGLVGRRLGCLFQRRAELTGGLVLIAIGVKILIEHLSGG